MDTCLCDFGCGNFALYTQKNGKKICSPKASQCQALREKNSKGNKGRIIDQEWRDKLSKSNKQTKSARQIQAWNKGVTKDAHPGMMAVSAAQKKLAVEQLQKIIPSDDPVYNNFRQYRTRIISRSNLTYRQNKELLNPRNLVIGRFGDEIYHLDHKFPVAEGFKFSVPIEMMASLDNLQLLKYNENIIKSNKLIDAIVPESIKQFIKERI